MYISLLSINSAASMYGTYIWTWACVNSLYMYLMGCVVSGHVWTVYSGLISVRVCVCVYTCWEDIIQFLLLGQCATVYSGISLLRTPLGTTWSNLIKEVSYFRGCLVYTLLYVDTSVGQQAVSWLEVSLIQRSLIEKFHYIYREAFEGEKF